MSKEYWATDAAIEKSSVGIGSYFDGDVISVTGTKEEVQHQLKITSNYEQKKNWRILPFKRDKKFKFTHNIQYLELFAFYWSLTTHIRKLKNKHIPIRIDNSNAYVWLVKGSAPVAYMPLLRAIQTVIFDSNITLYPIWVPSKVNLLADMASRGETITDEMKKITKLKETFTAVNHLIPGPNFLFGKGYLDGRVVTDAWGDNSLMIQSVLP